MLQILAAYIKREALIPLRWHLLSLRHKLLSLGAVASTIGKTSSSDTADHPPFDPSAPSPPVSFPIRTLEDLESRSYFDSFHYPFNRATVALNSEKAKLPERGRMLACHDMGGGYLDDDKWVQGGSNGGGYAIWHWYLIDVFVYFSHNLVTLPPPGWTNTAHKHGVKVLGTFITEWDEGKRICDKLLSSKESAHMYAERLTELALSLGFDGWLLNIEVNLDLRQIPFLKEFIGHLTQAMHSALPGSLVIWYDAVTIYGNLIWQDKLNENNKPYFDLCDGIFVNYTWKKDYPKWSADVAGDRKFDVYMGIDVFGRNTYGGGQWNTNVALDLLKKDNVSAAIFAPGWVYETKQLPDFQNAQNRWWSLIEESWGVLQIYPKVLPFYTNFDQGHGYHISINGEQVSENPWCNLASQSFQPLLKFPGDSSSDNIRAVVDFKEASYSGGGNIAFKGTLEHGTNFRTRLFKGELLGGKWPLHFIYSVKMEGGSMLGLVLELSSVSEGMQSVFLASSESALLTMNQFASKFDRVIMPQKVSKSEGSTGWLILESSIDIHDSTLTDIDAVCYKLQPETVYGSLEYHAVLGHLAIQLGNENLEFPLSTSWLLEGTYVNWTSVSEGPKFLSAKMTWQLKDAVKSIFPKYNIYVQKAGKDAVTHSGGTEYGVHEFLGVAHVEGYFVSDLLVPWGTSILKFTIQPCAVDGRTQKLEDSPSFQLPAEGFGLILYSSTIKIFINYTG